MLRLSFLVVQWLRCYGYRTHLPNNSVVKNLNHVIIVNFWTLPKSELTFWFLSKVKVHTLDCFSWGAHLFGLSLSVQFLMQGKAGRYAPVFEKYQQKAEYFMCSCLGKGTRNVQRTPGGLIFRQGWNNMQFVTSASFLATVYSDYLASASGRYMKCASGNVSPSELLSFSQSQVLWLSIGVSYQGSACLCYSLSLKYRLTTFLGTIQEPRVTWLDMATTSRPKFTTGHPQLCPLRLTLHLSAAEGAMPLGSAGKQVIPMFLLVLLLEDPMPTTTMLIKETIMSKLSLLLTTMLLFLVYWLD